MATTWEKADESVLKMAQEIIDKYHEPLRDALIGFLFRSEPGMSNGRTVMGMAKKVSEANKILLELDFIIWLSRPDWQGFEPSQRRALLDHELCHCAGDIYDGWKIRGHDVEEFAQIIERHGLWLYDLQRAALAIQPHLPSLDKLTRKIGGSLRLIDPTSGELLAEVS